MIAQRSKWILDVSPNDHVGVVAVRALKERLDAVQYYLTRAAEQTGNENTESVHLLRVWTRRSAAAMRLFQLLLPPRRAAWLQNLKDDKRFQSIIIFENHGEGAGTSLQHPHWQIIATPVVPRLLRLKCNEATEYFDRTGDCLYRVMLDDEVKAKKRLIAGNDEFVAFVPYAAHLPFETWILPRRPQAAWDSLQPAQIRPLAEILKTVVLKLYVALDNPDFNLTVDMAPRGDEDSAYFLWHIRVLPRVSTPAGFELGSGMSINTTMPEDAAAFLRDGDVR